MIKAHTSQSLLLCYTRCSRAFVFGNASGSCGTKGKWMKEIIFKHASVSKANGRQVHLILISMPICMPICMISPHENLKDRAYQPVQLRPSQVRTGAHVMAYDYNGDTMVINGVTR